MDITVHVLIQHIITEDVYKMGLQFLIELSSLLAQFSKLFQSSDIMVHDIMVNGVAKLKEILDDLDVTPLLNILDADPVTSNLGLTAHTSRVFPDYIKAIKNAMSSGKCGGRYLLQRRL